MKILIVLSLLAATSYCAQYAVLVAGSNGFYNYRH
jgi:legumain